MQLDLRTIRPQFVPNGVDEAADHGNRSSIFRDGEGHYFGFTFRDSLNNPNTSHHLLSCFSMREAQLDLFYQKLAESFVGVANSQIDAQQPAKRSGRSSVPACGIRLPLIRLPRQSLSTTAQSVPRGPRRLCQRRPSRRLLLHGDRAVHGELAARDGVLGNRLWNVELNPTYANYIAAGPDNTRMRTTRRSFHIRVNNAVIQEVSVFAIGQVFTTGRERRAGYQLQQQFRPAAIAEARGQRRTADQPPRRSRKIGAGRCPRSRSLPT